jgi:hypothetical protein
MATSPIYSWPEPDNTDLVKNGALAIRTMGDAIDTTMGTMVAKTIIDAKGDIIAGTAADTAARLAVGTNGQVLKANSATATGLEWAADSAGMTNPMTTTGDTIYSSSGSTPARLGIGSSGQVLTVASGVPSWATPSAGGSTYSGAYVYNSSATQTLTTGTWTIVTYDSEYYDTNTYHSTATNTGRMTIPSGKTGYYQIKASAVFVSNTTGYRQLRLQKNGASVIISGEAISGTGSQYPGISLNATLYLAAGDYIELNAIQTSGGNLDVYRDGQQGFLQIDYLGA